MINPQKPVINPIKIFNRFTALILITQYVYLCGVHTSLIKYHVPGR